MDSQGCSFIDVINPVSSKYIKIFLVFDMNSGLYQLF